MSDQQPIILDKIVRRYGRTLALDTVSITLAPRSITALLGPSGAGKSTLLRLIAGFEAPDDGEIRVGENIISRRGMAMPPEKRRIGLVFQDFALFPHLTALENVRFGLNALSRDQGLAIAADWLKRLGLAERKDAYPHQLSGGEQQRVSIARALAPEPAAILMDEPFSGLDAALRQDARDITLDALTRSGAPALIVTHDPADALLFADQVAILADGALAQTGAPHDVYQRPTSAAAAEALGPLNRLPVDISATRTLAAGAGLPTDQSVFVRPEGVLLSQGGVNAQVRRVSYLGPVATVVLDIDNLRLSAMTTTPPRQGEQVDVRLDPDLSYCFGTAGASAADN